MSSHNNPAIDKRTTHDVDLLAPDIEYRRQLIAIY